MRRHTLKMITLAVASLAIAGGIYVAIFTRASNDGKDQLLIDAAKSSLSFMVITIVGGLVMMFIKSYEDRRKNWQSRWDLLRTDLSESIWAQYGKIKQIRRLLRSAVNQKTRRINYSRYCDLLERLSETQIQIERIERISRLLVPHGVPETVPMNLDVMEKYLGTLVDEYEKIPADAQFVIIDDLHEMKTFIAKKELDTTFWIRLSEPHHRAAEAVEMAIQAELGE